MNWDQIEQKWAEMTRRVRADLSAPGAIGLASPRVAQPNDLPKVPIETVPPMASPVTGA